jgi:hypothetical protein
MKRIAALLTCGLLVLMIVGRADAVDFPTFSLPVFPGATNQKTHLDKPVKGAKAATYRIKTVFPARGLTDFYKKEMMDRGFKAFHDSFVTQKEFEWITFNSSTGDWKPAKLPPARYTAKWSNEKEDQLVWVVIEFNPDQIGQRRGNASVSVHVSRYSTYLKEVDGIKNSTHYYKEAAPAKSRR